MFGDAIAESSRCATSDSDGKESKITFLPDSGLLHHFMNCFRVRDSAISKNNDISINTMFLIKVEDVTKRFFDFCSAQISVCSFNYFINQSFLLFVIFIDYYPIRIPHFIVCSLPMSSMEWVVMMIIFVLFCDLSGLPWLEDMS